MSEVIQEAVLISSGMNYVPMRKRYRLPNQSKNASIYLLSNSYEYDVQMIKNIPDPKIDYKNIIIPYRIMDKIGPRPLRYMMTQNVYNAKVTYLNNQKLIPRVVSIKYPYPNKIDNNLYISMSDIIKKVNELLHPLSVQFIRDNIFGLFDKVMGWFNFSQTKVLLIDTKRFPIYRDMSMDVFKSDLINALLCAYMISPAEKIKNMKWIFIFRTPEADYKFDLSTFKVTDRTRMRQMLNTIGSKGEIINPDAIKDDTNADVESDDVLERVMTPSEEEKNEEGTIDDITSDITTTDGEETEEEIRNIQIKQTSTAKSLKTSLNALSAKFGIDNQKIENTSTEDDSQKVYNAKVTDITSQLSRRINKINVQSGEKILSNYKVISKEITSGNDDTKVEDKILDDASKNMAV